MVNFNSSCLQGCTLVEGEQAVSDNLISTNHILFREESEKDQLKWSDIAGPAVVKVMHENGFVTQRLSVLLEFRLGLHSPLPPSLHPTPLRLHHPSVFAANRTSNNPWTPQSPTVSLEPWLQSPPAITEVCTCSCSMTLNQLWMWSYV